MDIRSTEVLLHKKPAVPLEVHWRFYVHDNCDVVVLMFTVCGCRLINSSSLQCFGPWLAAIGLLLLSYIFLCHWLVGCLWPWAYPACCYGKCFYLVTKVFLSCDRSSHYSPPPLPQFIVVLGMTMLLDIIQLGIYFPIEQGRTAVGGKLFELYRFWLLY